MKILKIHNVVDKDDDEKYLKIRHDKWQDKVNDWMLNVARMRGESSTWARNLGYKQEDVEYKITKDIYDAFGKLYVVLNKYYKE